MTEWRLFQDGTIPEYTTAEWYDGRDNAAHLEDPGHRPRIVLAARMVADAAIRWPVTSVVDLGSGDGGMLSLVGPALRKWGYDIAPAAVTAGMQRGIDIRRANVLTDDIEWGDIAVATEILEHLIDPHAFVRMVAEHSPMMVCSSPCEETSESHYEFHAWAWDFDGYRALIEQAGYRVLRHEQTGPFQVMMAQRV